jgi:PPIC-type PPIASE domain
MQQGTPAPVRGRWRAVKATALSRSLLWVSVIQIRHRDAGSQVFGSPAPWRAPTPNPTRMHAEALDLARVVSEEARAQPDHFEALAARYSDDETTSSRGGYLGGVRASDLLAWGEVLDAIEALAPGQVSQPIDTRVGVIIVKLAEPPVEEQIAGRHIVFGHDDVRWLGMLGANVPRRTHREAWDLAEGLRRELSETPDRFAPLAAGRSDHPDKQVGGDLGSWSTREPTHLPRELAVLRGLRPGETSPAFETAFGVQVVQRAAARERAHYGLEAIRFGFAPNEPDTRAQAWAQAQRLLDELARTPSRFDELSREYCCTAAEEVIDGRQDSALTGVLARLQVGEVAPQAIQVQNQVLIPRRAALERVPPRDAVWLGLPSPDESARAN